MGQKLPNAWGLYDMLGNVWEWCHDGKRTYTSANVTNPMGSTEAGSVRAVRGGSLRDDARYVWAVARFWFNPGYRLDVLGFRCSSSGHSR